MDSRQQITFNIEAHDRVTRQYEMRHGEIFNPIEQKRLRRALESSLSAVRTSNAPIDALDIGCGSGNLTRHLLELGAHVVSADVSDGFLELVEKQFSFTGRVATLKINGTDLSNVDDDQFDFVATYSVLHHIPDYMAMVQEMCRVAKPGGVVYIDHEVTESYYERPEEYVEFLSKAKPKYDWRRYVRYLVDVKGYIHIVRRLLNPRYKREGDIHVWADDHIEWEKIEDTLANNGFRIILREDYLLYKSQYSVDIYNAYRNKCADERVMAARREL